MKTQKNIFMHNIPLLQAINDWQQSSDIEKGLKLKDLSSNLPLEFRSATGMMCYRKINLEKNFIWQLVAENQLKEKISSWSVDLNVTRNFKGGVPKQNGKYHGVILEIDPNENNIILNLEKLYSNKHFLDALEFNKNKIKNYKRGCGKYKNKQKEVILEVDSVCSLNICSLGGHCDIFDKPLPIWTTTEQTVRILNRLYSGDYKIKNNCYLSVY